MLKKIFRKSNQKGIGGKGEDLAIKYLKKQGYKIIEINWYNKKGRRVGEIDIIAQDTDQALVFVEVKSRTSSSEDVLPQDAITPVKLGKCARAAESYIAENNLWDKHWRIDAIAIVFCDEKKYSLNHMKNIFY